MVLPLLLLFQIERNLQDAMQVARNVVFDPLLLPGGGATEMAIGQALARSSTEIEGVQQWPYRAMGKALEVRRESLFELAHRSTVLTLLSPVLGDSTHTRGELRRPDCACHDSPASQALDSGEQQLGYRRYDRPACRHD